MCTSPKASCRADSPVEMRPSTASVVSIVVISGAAREIREGVSMKNKIVRASIAVMTLITLAAVVGASSKWV